MPKEQTKHLRAHTRYFNQAGKRVPGTTTISGLLDKSRFLVPWANRLGLQGIDSSKYVDEKAAAGSLAHAMVLDHLKGEEPDLKAYTQYQIDQAENSFLKYLAWEQQHDIEVMFCEEPMVSEQYQFGGTMDLHARVDDRPELVDFKTGKGIYQDHWIQVGGGYAIIMKELGYDFEAVRILQIGRDESEGFNEYIRTDTSVEQEIFLHLRQIYELQKQLRGD